MDDAVPATVRAVPVEEISPNAALERVRFDTAATAVALAKTLPTRNRSRGLFSADFLLTSRTCRVYPSTGRPQRVFGSRTPVPARCLLRQVFSPGAVTCVAESGVCGAVRHGTAGKWLGRGVVRSRVVGAVQQDHVGAVTAARDLSPELLQTMHRYAFGLPSGWTLPGSLHLARSGTLPGALGKQLSALDRRRLLRLQQQSIQAGKAHPPFRALYLRRFRPPS
jgi:hypothetical protein